MGDRLSVLAAALGLISFSPALATAQDYSFQEGEQEKIESTMENREFRIPLVDDLPVENREFRIPLVDDSLFYPSGLMEPITLPRGNDVQGNLQTYLAEQEENEGPIEGIIIKNQKDERAEEGGISFRLTFGGGFSYFENQVYNSYLLRLTLGSNLLRDQGDFFFQFGYNSSRPSSEENVFDLGIIEFEGTDRYERKNASFGFGGNLFDYQFWSQIIALNVFSDLFLSGHIDITYSTFNPEEVDQEIPNDIDFAFYAGPCVALGASLRPFAFLEDRALERIGLGVQGSSCLLFDTDDFGGSSSLFHNLNFSVSYTFN